MNCGSTTFIGKDCESRSLIDRIEKAKSFYCGKLRQYKRIVATSCVEFPEDVVTPEEPSSDFVCTLVQDEPETQTQDIKYFDVTTIDLEVLNAMDLLEQELCGLEELILILDQKIKDHCTEPAIE
jgi:hypothetical protein